MIMKDSKYDLNGHKLVLRNATEEDAQILIDCLKTTAVETPYLIKELEEINLTLEEEIEFIRMNNESENSELIMGFLDGEYVGNCSIIGNSRLRYKHRATVGIALYLKYTNMGIGSIMFEKMIENAYEKGIEQLELEVVASNQSGLALYKKMGFETWGTFPNKMKYKDGTYADCYWMIKKL